MSVFIILNLLQVFNTLKTWATKKADTEKLNLLRTGAGEKYQRSHEYKKEPMH